MYSYLICIRKRNTNKTTDKKLRNKATVIRRITATFSEVITIDQRKIVAGHGLVVTIRTIPICVQRGHNTQTQNIKIRFFVHVLTVPCSPTSHANARRGGYEINQIHVSH